MELQELVEITTNLFYANCSSFNVILSKQKELLAVMNPKCNIQQIDYKKVNNYIKYLKEQGNSNATINAKVAYLSKILSYAEQNFLIERKPYIPHFKVIKNKSKYFSREDLTAMLLWCRKNKQKDLQKIILIGYYTGLRINNILSVSRFNFDGENLAVYDKKTNSNFILPISKKIRYIIDGLEGFDFDYNRVYYVFQMMKSDLRFDKELTIHSLRHSFCSTLNKNGVPIPTIQKLVNHKNIQTTMRYTHINIEECKKAVNML